MKCAQVFIQNKNLSQVVIKNTSLIVEFVISYQVLLLPCAILQNSMKN